MVTVYLIFKFAAPSINASSHKKGLIAVVLCCVLLILFTYFFLSTKGLVMFDFRFIKLIFSFSASTGELADVVAVPI